MNFPIEDPVMNDYCLAFEEFEDSGDAAAWDSVTADGLDADDPSTQLEWW